MAENVNVIGAGTAGLIAARRLGELGIHAIVYDQKRTPGLPARASGILSISGLSTLGMSYSPCITNTLYGANIHAGGRAMRVRSERAVAQVLDRKMLNDRCMDAALDMGADVHTGIRLSGTALDGMSKDGVVIGADGAVSAVAAHFGIGQAPRNVLTWKAEYRVDAPEEGMVDLFFDNRAYRGLFAWLCPNSEDVLEVGVGIDSRYGNAKDAFEKFISREEVRGIIGNKRPVTEHASLIPMNMRRKIADEARRVLLVGDAAGQVKPTTGGGIIFGGNAALMAAEAVRGYIDGTGRLSEYSRRFLRKYGVDVAMHAAINSIYSSAPSGALGGAITVLKAFGVDKFLGEYGDMDRPTVMLKRFFLRSLAL